ncbi:MAG TPA: transglycosylase domain-containing protein [Acidimicrobiales bacterium]|nr:transglycosylase domain-containing protein [Acidimicrobiales bacterium]
MLRRFGKTVSVLILGALTMPPTAVATVVLSLIFLPLPINLPRANASAVSSISHVYDANGTEIAVLREFDQHISVKKSDIPLQLKQAVVSSEDKNFYKHSGIDLRGSVRALVADLRGRRVEQGGSTITQQYVKNVYTNRARTITRKVREAILANQVDRKYSKDEILYRYLNTIYLGDGAYGVGAAAETYFHKSVKDLTLSESAMLAGIIPAPSAFEPRGNPESANTRRLHVLDLMLKEHYITQADHDAAAAQTVWPVTKGKPTGPVTLIQSPVKEYRKYPYFVDYVEKYLQARGYQPDKAGFKIYTTIDPAAQKAAEKAVSDSLSGTQDPIEMALTSVEPPTGFVRAMVGGRDFYNGPVANVNLALGGCPKKAVLGSGVPLRDDQIKVAASCWTDPTAEISGGGPGRQTGSAFKPFTLATALEQGIPPTKVYPAPRVYHVPNCKPIPGNDCTIGNAEGEGGAPQTLRTAIAESTNTVFAQLERDVGIDNLVSMAKRLGMSSAYYAPVNQGYAGVTLGVLDVSPLDMASAYSVFANRGLRAPATPIVKVVDAAGKTIIDNTKAAEKAKRVIAEPVADNVTDMLRGVIDHGTGTAANIGRPAAGKTGTGQNFTNAWFVGYTPTLSTAVWMGNALKLEPLVHIKGVSRVFGGTIPARTWKAFMSEALKDVPVTDFSQPAPIRSVADDLRRAARQGFDPGNRREPSDITSGSKFEYDVTPPTAVAPETTTTTEPPTTTTTSAGGITFP